ncbi:MAG TPA: DUF1843 domain-containing protein [Pyrinomonadaceae bacterium]|nr:DUF1843 domain-containing protein [Pyrinomonadaceae bacterium]
MPARKGPNKKLALKSAPTKKKNSSVGIRIRPLYAVPIYEAVASGDVNEMKRLATEARKQVAAVSKALHGLDSQIMKLSGK